MEKPRVERVVGWVPLFPSLLGHLNVNKTGEGGQCVTGQCCCSSHIIGEGFQLHHPCAVVPQEVRSFQLITAPQSRIPPEVVLLFRCAGAGIGPSMEQFSSLTLQKTFIFLPGWFLGDDLATWLI